MQNQRNRGAGSKVSRPPFFFLASAEAARRGARAGELGLAGAATRGGGGARELGLHLGGILVGGGGVERRGKAAHRA